MELATDQETAIAAIESMTALVDEILDATDGNVLLLKEEVRHLTGERDRLQGDLDRILDRAEYWITEARQWQEKYIGMRRERNDAMEQWLDYMEHQWALEQHLEGHEDEIRNKVRATARGERDRVARVLAERFEMWALKNGVEAEDLGEAEPSDY